MNTQAEDDDQFKALCEWRSGEAAEMRRRTDGKSRRWPTILLVGAVLIALALLAVGRVEAGGTVTDSKYIVLQRSGVTLTDKTKPPLACPPPKTVLECVACMAEMVDAEIQRRTSGYVTYRCQDTSQSFVRFNTTPPVVPPPVAHLQVYACPEQGADGRILESVTEPRVTWPNCPTASFQDPSPSLVVAVNPGTWPFLWMDVLQAEQENVRAWVKVNGVGQWVRAKEINWGTSPNRAPTISGQPAASVQAGTAYAFTPTAADADGDTLAFSIANKPSWAAFSTSTGKLSGTPATANVGAYSNIVIKASDGVVSTELPAFSIVVNQASLGTATIRWTPPTENTDGTPLTDLAGYRVVYGPSPNLLVPMTQVSAGVTSTIAENLTPGTWYFAVKAYNTAGSESVLSDVGSKAIP